MARLRQLFPSNYGFQGNTSAEFENVIRYLNAAEIGNLTVAELLRRIFDDEGNFDGPIEFRHDALKGIEYRIGEYFLNGVPQPEAGWKELVPASAMRGPAGVNFGEVFSPVSSTRQEVVADEGQTTILVSLNLNDMTIVYLNGVLQRVGPTHDYIQQSASNPTAIIFNNPLTAGDEVSIFRVTDPYTDGYERVDWDVDSDRTVFAFGLDVSKKPMVYHNGILQREGISGDYTVDAATGQIIFNTVIPAGDDVAAILIRNEAQSVVAGLMLESTFVDPATGNILGDRVQYEDGGFPQSKVAGLVAAMNAMASATASATPPDPPTLFWLDTSLTQPAMKFWTGSQYVSTSGSTGLPIFTPSDAGLFVKINGTGTGYSYGAPDLSGLIPTAQRGAANGVATLDANGRLVASQAPSPRNQRIIWRKIDGAIADGIAHVGRIYLEKVRILGFIAVLDGGTASAEITAGGASVSSGFSLGVSITETALGSPVILDSSGSSIALGVSISSASAATGLEVGIVIETVS